MHDKLGKIAMRTITGSIVGAIIVVFIAKESVSGFPFGWWGLIGACVLAAVSFMVGQVE